MSEIPKYEITQQVKRVLVRHAVNLVKVRVACTQYSVHFRGELGKDPQGDFDAVGIKTLCKDLERLPYSLRLFFDVENWNISFDGSWNISKRRKMKGGGQRMDEAYVIDNADPLEDMVLELEDD